MAPSAAEPVWLKSTACSGDACVEVAKIADQVLIRDSKNPSVVLRLSDAQWASFTRQIRGD